MEIRLSPREREVLQLIADGNTDIEIAEQLHIGERSARRHVVNMYYKLGAVNRPNAIHRAWQEGILK